MLDYFGVSRGLTVIGTSMGGHIAGTLVKEYGIDNLVLFCPAAYSSDAWDVGFSSGFTDIIRADRSYRQADLPEILGAYRGRAFFIIGTEDEVIPRGVTEMYLRSLSRAAELQVSEIAGCPHRIHRWGRTFPEKREEILLRLGRFLKAGSAGKSRPRERTVT